MELLNNLLLGLSVAFTPTNLAYCFAGVFLGTLVGVLPGIGAMTAVSLLLPITYYLDPTAAIVMLAGVYYGGAYGGSTASILLNLPGNPSSAVTCLDGYPMAKSGRSGVALLITTMASFFGGSIGIILMMLFSPIIVEFAVHFGPAEYFSMMLLGLIAASTVGSGTPIKGIAMIVLGVLLGLVGTDINSGEERFVFGIAELSEGISLIIVAMGLFGVAEVIASIRGSHERRISGKSVTLKSMVPTRDDRRRFWGPMLRGSSIGSFFGTLPGTGAAIASFMAYATEKKISREPERFGQGAVEGITAPEAANNAADQTSFIPTLTLGIPGSVMMALIMGALMIHGITPGPMLMTEHPDMFWGLIMSFWVGNVMLLVLNIPMIGLWVRLLSVPYHLLYPAIMMFVCIGVYSIHNNAFDVVLLLVFGVLGYAMRLLGFHPAPLVLGLVLGPMLEENLRRALLMSRGEYMVFLERPLSATFIAITVCLLMLMAFSMYRSSRQASA
jgi:putative tricarboxylic transport membrane protein